MIGEHRAEVIARHRSPLRFLKESVILIRAAGRAD